jgi:hypothetical protein
MNSTRILTDEQIRFRMKNGCPVHGEQLIEKTRWIRDEETDEKKRSGNYWCCPLYAKGECEYYLGIGDQSVGSYPREKVILGCDSPPGQEFNRDLPKILSEIPQKQSASIRERMRQGSRMLLDKFRKISHDDR